MSRRTTAEALDVNERTLDRMHVQGTGPRRIQITRRLVGYERSEVERWVKSRSFASQAEALAKAAANAMRPRKKAATQELLSHQPPVEIQGPDVPTAAPPARRQKPRKPLTLTAVARERREMLAATEVSTFDADEQPPAPRTRKRTA